MGHRPRALPLRRPTPRAPAAAHPPSGAFLLLCLTLTATPDHRQVRALSPAFVLLWLLYFNLLVLVVEMMPSRLNRQSAAFVGSRCNTIFWSASP